MSKSIMQDEKVCFVTGVTRGLDKHHIFHGPRRKKAEEYGCWCWLAHDLHMDLHERYPELDRDLKECCQKLFEEKWGHKKFMDVFGKNYIREEKDDV